MKQTTFEAVNNLNKAWGNFLIQLGVMLLVIGLGKHGKKMNALLRKDIKAVFQEGFDMGRDTIDMSLEDEVLFWENHGLYNREEAWFNSDSEEIIPEGDPQNQALDAAGFGIQFESRVYEKIASNWAIYNATYLKVLREGETERYYMVAVDKYTGGITALTDLQ